MVVPRVPILVVGHLAGSIVACAIAVVMMLVGRDGARYMRGLVHAPGRRRRAQAEGCKRQNQGAAEKAE